MGIDFWFTSHYNELMGFNNSRQTNKSRAIIAFREANPQVSMKEIGQLFPGNGKPLTKQRVWAILNHKTCRNCYHKLAMGALCACRAKADMLKRNCPDWYPQTHKRS